MAFPPSELEGKRGEEKTRKQSVHGRNILPGSLFHPSIVAVGTQVTGRESNNPDNGGYIFFTLFFFSFFFPSLPYSSITLKTMLRARSTAYRNALSLVTSRAKPVNYIFTPFDETSPPLLSLSFHPFAHGLREPADQPTGREINADFSSVDSTTLIAPVI